MVTPLFFLKSSKPHKSSNAHRHPRVEAAWPNGSLFFLLGITQSFSHMAPWKTPSLCTSFPITAVKCLRHASIIIFKQ